MDISIVIPNYNGEKLLQKNLPKIIEAAKSYKKGKTEIIVVDDASADNSRDVIKNNSVVLIKNQKNLGFSSTVNRGVAYAKGEIVILLNTDVAPQENFIEPLISHFSDEKVFAVGALDKSVEKGKIVERGRGLGQWKRGFLVHRRGEVDKTNTLWVSGGSGAFRKSIWEKLGGLNELYNPFYWEDIDISCRALKSGYKILFDPKSVVWHYHEEGSIRSKYSKAQIKTIAYRNQFIFFWQNVTDLELWFSHIFWLPYHFLKALLRFDWPLFIAFFEALVLTPKIIRLRTSYQKLFIKMDKDIIREFA